MSFETIIAILFFIFLTLFLIKERKKIQLQKILWPILYFAMYKTKLGLKQMDSISKKHPKIVDVLSKIGVFAGIIGMIVICWLLVENLIDLFLIPEAVSGVGLVLPFKIKGGFYVPFLYWIVSISIIAAIHEFSHGVVARLHNVKIHSSGFAFLGLIIPVVPAAFVEPDEKSLIKKKTMQKLSVYAAGPFSNVVSGALFLLLFLFLTVPVATAVFDFNGVKVEGFTENSSSEASGMFEGSVIKQIDGKEIMFITNLSDSLKNKKVGENVSVITTNGTFNVILKENPKNVSQPYLGVLISQSQQTKPEFESKYGKFTAPVILWFMGLFYWLYLLSLGIGLFNLIPVGPVDGGQMSREMFKSAIKDERKAIKAWHWTSLVFFAIIMLNLLRGFF